MNIIGKYFVWDGSAEELSQVAKMDQDFFPRPWTEKDWSGINWAHHLLMVRKIGRVIDGYILLGVVAGDETAHLIKILLHPDVRGIGEATLMMENARQELSQKGFSKLFLEVEASNLRAQRFYEKFGFRILRRMKAYYSDGEDAISMELTL